MTDKVKIRKEVEKIARSINPYIPDEEGKNSEYEAGRLAMAIQILQYIDSMQEEPVSSNIDFEQELYKAFGQVKDFTLGMQIAKWFYDMGKNSQEPVSVWHDSNKEQPNYASTVAIWDPKYKNGEIISRCTEVYPDRIWAYIDDLLKI